MCYIYRLYCCFCIVSITTFTTANAAAIENLDEMEARKSRRATNTYYHGASSGNSYVRQPEQLIYTDITTGAEVHVMSSTPNKSNIYYTDISPANPWSADGSRLGFFSNRDVLSFTRYAGTSLDGTLASAFVMRSDGSYMRETDGSANRGWGSVGMYYFFWAPTVPNIYYTSGEAYNGLSLDRNAIYKNTVSDTSVSYSMLIDILPGDASSSMSLKKVISPDGKYLLPKIGGYPNSLYYPTQVYPDISAQVLDSDGWNEQRGQTDEWAGGSPFACRHDMYFPSSDFFILLFSQDCNDVDPVMYKYNLTGTDTDGGPDFDPTETTYTSFNDFEMEPLWTWSSTHVPWKLEPTNTRHKWGHPGFGRWGRIVVFNDGSAYHEDNGVNDWAGPVAWDYVNRIIVAEPTETEYPKALVEKGGSYVDFNAWSDYFAYSKNGWDDVDSERWILTAEYNVTHDDGNDWWYVAIHHQNQNSSTSYHWTSNDRVAQSPDGTKVSYAITFLTDVANTGDLAYAVAYYPHPPEIISTASNLGTYTIRFDWRTDQATSRGYSQRGWPDESKDEPPPPRETRSFRLWRSTDSSTWKPIKIIDADIFSKYNFSTGVWNDNKYWVFTDTPGEGTFYYAITAIEHSGLESRTLSNIYSTANIETSPYPPDPKKKRPFYTINPVSPEFSITKLTIPGQNRIDWTEPNDFLIRYYNIYYSSVSQPQPIQQNRIASIPKGINSYVDWLADPSAEDGYYLVTSVDSQGNESSSVVRPKILSITQPTQPRIN